MNNLMLITGEHRLLFSMLKKLKLGEEKRLKAKTVNLFDFGAKIQIIVSLAKGKTEIKLQAIFEKDYEIHNEALDYLRTLYGPTVGFDRPDDHHRVTISVTPKEAIARFNSAQSCARSLSQIRVQATGAPILNALGRLEAQFPGQAPHQDKIYKLGSHGKCGTYHCISNNQKVMVVFVVSFEDEMERCLARLFLQQFEVAQRKIPLTPHCEFRRPNQASTELKRVMEHDIGSENDQILLSPVGFLSFTFFPSSAASNERNLIAVELLVNFLPYMNRHVKSTKSIMLNRMRSKRNDLLPPLKDPVHSISW